MKKLLSLLVIAILITACAKTVDVKKDEVSPIIVAADVITLRASVDSIDYNKRTLNIKGPDGNILTVKASKDIQNFNNIKKGDNIVADYAESVAVYIDNANEKPNIDTSGKYTVAPKGKKPFAEAVGAIKITALVQDINYNTRVVTIKGPEGNVKEFDIDPSVKNLEKLKKGDNIIIVITEAVAVGVTKK